MNFVYKTFYGVLPQCGQLKEFIKNLQFPQALFYRYFSDISPFFSKKLLTKPPKSAVASRPVNQGIVHFTANLDFTLGGMSYESN